MSAGCRTGPGRGVQWKHSGDTMAARAALWMAAAVVILFVVTGTLGLSPTPPSVDLCKHCCKKGGVCPAICPGCSIINPPPSCGLNCQGPCTIRNGRPVCLLPTDKPGQCPVNDLAPIIFCASPSPDQCSSDAACPGAQKCCSYGCARRCTPVCLPGCGHHDLCRLQKKPSAIITPDVTASCERASGFCKGVRCPPGQRCQVIGGAGTCVPVPVHVPSVGVCPVSTVDVCTAVVRPDQCSSDAACPPGQKCCHHDCERKCVPACPRRCRHGQTCQLETFASCLAVGICPPPPPPRAVCKSSGGPSPIRTGVCPVNNLITTCQVRDDACSSDDECAAGERCCNRGCGRACVPVCRRPCPLKQKCVLVDSGIRCVTTPCPSLKAVCQGRHIKPIG